MTYILNTSPQLTIPPRTIAQCIPQWASAVSRLLRLTPDTEHKDSAYFHMDILTPWSAFGTVIKKKTQNKTVLSIFTCQYLTAIGKYWHWQRYNTQNIDFPLWSPGSLCAVKHLLSWVRRSVYSLWAGNEACSIIWLEEKGASGSLNWNWLQVHLRTTRTWL